MGRKIRGPDSEAGDHSLIFTPTSIPGAYIVDIEPRRDDRGFFTRSWCVNEFERNGLNARLVQCNISFNQQRGTLRGMHYQAAPHPEAKLVRCTRGAIYDVVLDLRPDSPGYLKWQGVELSDTNHRALFIPDGCAHGFQSLTDNSEVLYHMSEFYHADLARGVRWNDPAFGISWPIPQPILSERDAALADYTP